MGQLTNQYVSQSYQGLLKMTNSTTGVTGTLQTVQTGDGTDTPLQISKTEVNISGSLTVNGAPISIATGSFATTGSNTFTGNQLITGSDGSVILRGSTSGTTDNSLLSIHAANDGPWIGRYFNDTFSTASSVLSFWGDNNGTFHFHNESTASIKFGVNNYGDNFILNDTNVTSNRDLIVSGAIKTDGAITFSNSAFNSTTNVSGALYFSSLNNGTLHLNDDGGEGDVFIGWGPNNTHIRGNTNITGSLHQSGTFYPDVIDWVSSSIVQNTGSYVLTTNTSGVTQYDTYQNVASAIQPYLTTGSGVPSGTVSGSAQVAAFGYATTSSVNSLSQSIATTDLNQNNVIAGLATTSSLTSLSSSIATTDLGQNNRLTSIEGITGSLATTSSLTSLSSSIATTDLDQNNRLGSIESKTGSYATTGSNVFNGNQTISGSLIVTGSITALSASITYLEVVYESSSVIFSSGSNILGDASNDTQTLWGTVKIPSGPVSITGSLTVSGSISGSNFTGSLQGSASYASNANSASYASNATSSSYASNANSASFATNAISASRAVSSSFSTNATSSSYANTSTSSSYASNATSASYSNNSTSSSFAQTSISSSQAANAVSASQAQNAVSSSYSNNSTSSSYSNNSTSSSYASNATSASFSQNTISGSFSNFAVSSSYSNFALSASQAQNAVTASFLNGTIASASYAVNADTASIAFDLVVYGKCDNPGGLTKGTIVRITGANGDNPLFNSASWTNDPTSANTLGMLTANVAYNAFANVVTQGTVIGINTSGMTAGDLLFLSSSGQYTTSSVPAPYHEVRLGQVLRSNLNNGSAYISIDNGYELTELHDVDITSPVNGDLLVYRSGSYGQWVNETGGELGFATTSSVNQKLDTGSFNSYTASMDARTGSYITTGSAASSQSITGSLLISGSQNNVIVSGSINQRLPFIGTGTNAAVTNSFIGNVYITGSGNGAHALKISGSAQISRTATIGLSNSGSNGSILVQGSSAINSTYGSGSATLIAAVYDNSSYETDFMIVATPTGSQVMDYNYITSQNENWLKIGYNSNNSPIPQMVRGLGITGSLNVNGVTIMSSSAVYPLYVSGTIAIQRTHFDGNPFNSSPSSNLAAQRIDDFNTSFNTSMYNRAEITTASYVRQTVDTGSNFVRTQLLSQNAGFNAILSLENNGGNGILTSNVNTEITGTLKIANPSSSYAQVELSGSIGGGILQSKGDLYVQGHVFGNMTSIGDVILTTTGSKSVKVISNTFNIVSNTSQTGSISITQDLIVNNTMKIGLGAGTIASNIAIGTGSLSSNTTGAGNIAIGSGSLRYYATTGNAYNVGVGLDTLGLLTSGSSFAAGTVNNNTMLGTFGGASLTSGSRNTGVGASSMQFADKTERNTAVGRASLYNVGSLYGSGSKYNVAVGHNAGFAFISGSNNILLMGGSVAGEGLVSGSNNTIVGPDVNVPASGNGNTIIGRQFTLAQMGGNTASGSVVIGDGNGNVAISKVNATSSLVIPSSVNITGSLTISGSVNITGSVQGNVNALSIASSTASLDLNNGNFFTLQLVSGSNTFINPSNIKAGQTVNILLSTTGSGTVTFPTSVLQVSGSSYTPTTTTGKDIITLVSFDSTNLYLANVKNLI